MQGALARVTARRPSGAAFVCARHGLATCNRGADYGFWTDRAAHFPHGGLHMNAHIARPAQVLALVVVFLSLILSDRPAQAQATLQLAVCASTYIVQPGDTLSAISARTANGTGGYAAIVSATNAQAAADPSFATIENPNALSVGWKLCIPTGTVASSTVTPSTVTPSTGMAAPRTPAANPSAAQPSQAASATATPIAAEENISDTADIDFDPEKLTIDWLREQVTPGSDIVIEQTLAPGSNYDRYLASYLSEGLRIDAYMTVPQGTPPETGWPVVVFNHGYIPPEVYRPTERYIAYQDAFARNGYIVFRPDYRGHADSEGEPTGAYGDPGYEIDVLNAISSIQRYPQADAHRVGLWGHSMGGYLTLRAMVARDDIRAGVIWAGVVGDYEDMLYNWRRPNSQPPPSVSPRARRWRTELLEEKGTPAENPAFWDSISANAYLADLSGPVQLHHGTLDEEVPITFTRTLSDEIGAAGGVVEYYEYPGDNHNLSGSLSTALERSVAWFDKYVKNAE